MTDIQYHYYHLVNAVTGKFVEQSKTTISDRDQLLVLLKIAHDINIKYIGPETFLELCREAIKI